MSHQTSSPPNIQQMSGWLVPAPPQLFSLRQHPATSRGHVEVNAPLTKAELCSSTLIEPVQTVVSGRGNACIVTLGHSAQVDLLHSHPQPQCHDGSTTKPDQPVSNCPTPGTSNLVPAASETRVTCVQDAIQVCNRVLTNRSQGENERNSHLFITLHLYLYELQSGGEKGKQPNLIGGRRRLTICDIGTGTSASSSPVSNATKGSHQNHQHRQSHMSFAAIAQVITALLHGQRYLPFRDRLLTQVLQHILPSPSHQPQQSSSNNSQSYGSCVNILACIQAGPAHWHDAMNVLQLAGKLAHFRTKCQNVPAARARGSHNGSDPESQQKHVLKHKYYRTSDGECGAQSSSEQSNAETVIFLGGYGSNADTTKPVNYAYGGICSGREQNRAGKNSADGYNSSNSDRSNSGNKRTKRSGLVMGTCAQRLASSGEIWIDGPKAQTPTNSQTPQWIDGPPVLAPGQIKQISGDNKVSKESKRASSFSASDRAGKSMDPVKLTMVEQWVTGINAHHAGINSKISDSHSSPEALPPPSILQQQNVTDVEHEYVAIDEKVCQNESGTSAVQGQYLLANVQYQSVEEAKCTVQSDAWCTEIQEIAKLDGLENLAETHFLEDISECDEDNLSSARSQNSSNKSKLEKKNGQSNVDNFGSDLLQKYYDTCERNRMEHLCETISLPGIPCDMSVKSSTDSNENNHSSPNSSESLLERAMAASVSSVRSHDVLVKLRQQSECHADQTGQVDCLVPVYDNLTARDQCQGPSSHKHSSSPVEQGHSTQPRKTSDTSKPKPNPTTSKCSSIHIDLDKSLEHNVGIQQTSTMPQQQHNGRHTAATLFTECCASVQTCSNGCGDGLECLAQHEQSGGRDDVNVKAKGPKGISPVNDTNTADIHSKMGHPVNWLETEQRPIPLMQRQASSFRTPEPSSKKFDDDMMQNTEQIQNNTLPRELKRCQQKCDRNNGAVQSPHRQKDRIVTGFMSFLKSPISSRKTNKGQNGKPLQTAQDSVPVQSGKPPIPSKSTHQTHKQKIAVPQYPVLLQSPGSSNMKHAPIQNESPCKLKHRSVVKNRGGPVKLAPNHCGNYVQSKRASSGYDSGHDSGVATTYSSASPAPDHYVPVGLMPGKADRLSLRDRLSGTHVVASGSGNRRSLATTLSSGHGSDTNCDQPAPQPETKLPTNSQSNKIGHPVATTSGHNGGSSTNAIANSFRRHFGWFWIWDVLQCSVWMEKFSCVVNGYSEGGCIYTLKLKNNFTGFSKSSTRSSRRKLEQNQPISKLTQMQSKQDMLKQQLSDAKRALHIPDTKWTYGLHAAHWICGTESARIDAMNQELRVLEKRVIAARNHAMYVTAFV